MCKPYLAFERPYWPNKYYLNILCPLWESVCFEVFPLSDFSCCCHQTLERSNLKKEGSILAHTGGCSPPCGAGMVVGTTWGCGSNWLGLFSSLSSSNRNQACGRKWNKAITLRGIFLTLTLSLATCWWGPGSLVYSAWNKTWKRADLEPGMLLSMRVNASWSFDLLAWNIGMIVSPRMRSVKCLEPLQSPSVRRNLRTHATSIPLVTGMQARVADSSFRYALLLGCESEVPLVGWDVLLCPGGTTCVICPKARSLPQAGCCSPFLSHG